MPSGHVLFVFGASFAPVMISQEESRAETVRSRKRPQVCPIAMARAIECARTQVRFDSGDGAASLSASCTARTREHGPGQQGAAGGGNRRQASTTACSLQKTHRSSRAACPSRRAATAAHGRLRRAAHRWRPVPHPLPPGRRRQSAPLTPCRHGGRGCCAPSSWPPAP